MTLSTRLCILAIVAVVIIGALAMYSAVAGDDRDGNRTGRAYYACVQRGRPDC